MTTHQRFPIRDLLLQSGVWLASAHHHRFPYSCAAIKHLYLRRIITKHVGLVCSTEWSRRCVWKYWDCFWFDRCWCWHDFHQLSETSNPWHFPWLKEMQDFLNHLLSNPSVAVRNLQDSKLGFRNFRSGSQFHSSLWCTMSSTIWQWYERVWILTLSTW